MVKRVAALLLLVILFFNWIGYRFLSSYLEDEANISLESRLDDNNYNESELVSIKIPAQHLAYYYNSKTFERVDGEVEISGVQYKYVKKRLFNDSLEYLCIPNTDVNKLRTARDEFFKLVNDLQLNGQEKKSSPHSNNSKNFIADYDIEDHTLNAYASLQVINIEFVSNESGLSHCFIPVAEQPPDFC
jgi:hypothetical protein